MVAAIIQARVGSTRFPNKVFAELCGKPLIWHVVNRLKWSKKIQNILLATTLNPADTSLEKWARANNIEVFRGSENDVLSRYYHAALSSKATTIVRITADDPFKDPEIIDKVVDIYFSNNLDFAYNNNPPTFPEGLDTEVFSFQALEKAEKESLNAFEREHVTQYFYRKPEIFKQMNIPYSEDLSFLRWTIDTKQDLEMAKQVYKYLYKENKIFLMNDILRLFKDEPHIKKINMDVKRSNMYSENEKIS